MNVYDFDKTIYAGDSSIDFYLFCIEQNFALIKFLPKQLLSTVAFLLKRISKEEYKSRYFSFLSEVENLDVQLENFWERNQNKIKKWYFKIKCDDDCVITASPEFLIQPICKRLGIKNLIASIVDAKTGCFIGKNCYGEEKLIRFIERFPSGKIDDFYSDSMSDRKLAEFAKHSYLVKGNDLRVWKK